MQTFSVPLGRVLCCEPKLASVFMVARSGQAGDGQLEQSGPGFAGQRRSMRMHSIYIGSARWTWGRAKSDQAPAGNPGVGQPRAHGSPRSPVCFSEARLRPGMGGPALDRSPRPSRANVLVLDENSGRPSGLRASAGSVEAGSLRRETQLRSDCETLEARTSGAAGLEPPGSGSCRPATSGAGLRPSPAARRKLPHLPASYPPRPSGLLRRARWSETPLAVAPQSGHIPGHASPLQACRSPASPRLSETITELGSLRGGGPCLRIRGDRPRVRHNTGRSDWRPAPRPPCLPRRHLRAIRPCKQRGPAARRPVHRSGRHERQAGGRLPGTRPGRMRASRSRLRTCPADRAAVAAAASRRAAVRNDDFPASPPGRSSARSGDSPPWGRSACEIPGRTANRICLLTSIPCSSDQGTTRIGARRIPAWTDP